MPRRGSSSRSTRSSSSGVKVTAVKNQRCLSSHASKRSAVRVGATKSPPTRSGQYANSGYHGTMYVAKTSNMKAAENKLLANHSGRHNVQKTSNAAATSGYVYTIVGQKRSST
mmetsp:Transcript_14151/g.22089  ORF Transcript_14151/g.22089 Transcript_14151/m.22089 type:complete len:113 (-) Transcript_14151:192-530(-)